MFVRCKTKEGEAGWKYGEDSTCAPSLKDAIKRALTLESGDKVYRDLEEVRGEFNNLISTCSKLDLLSLVGCAKSGKLCDEVKAVYIERFGVEND